MTPLVLADSHDQSPAFERVFRGPYHFYSRERIAEETANALVHLVKARGEEGPQTTLGGRGGRVLGELPHLGRVFVKRYAHGGLFRAVSGATFLNIGPSRARCEFEMLERVRAMGVNAPKPLLFAMRGSLLYQAWLVMEEIPNTRSLAEVSANDPEALDGAMEQLDAHLRVLIAEGVFHVDLHPGNVLLSPEGRVFIVDFDKAQIFQGSSAQLREMYLRRWRRAVIKHRLSPLLTERMSLSLRSSHA